MTHTHHASGHDHNAQNEVLWKMIQQSQSEVNVNSRAVKQVLTEETAREENAKNSRLEKKQHLQTIKQQGVKAPLAKKDTVATSKETPPQTLTSAKKSAEKPPVPAPSNPFGQGSGLSDQGNKSITAIIGLVLILQAKTNTDFWKQAYQQATQYMTMALDTSKTQAANIKTQYAAQADATQQEADMAKKTAITSLVMFGAGMVMAGISPSEEPEEDNDGNNVDAENLVQNDDGANNPTNEQINESEQEDQPSGARRAWNSVKKAGGWAQKNIMGRMMKGMGVMNGLAMANQGVTGLIEHHFKCKIATQQGIQGQAAAAARQQEGFNQYWNNNFSRTEEIRQQAGQGIEQSMSVLKSASDTATQAVFSMFN